MNNQDFDPVQVYEAANSTEAQLILQMLQDFGIYARIAHDRLETVAGAIPFQLTGVPIWVRSVDRERALSLIHSRSTPQ